MAVYTNANANGNHGVFRSSRLKATESGHLYDVVVRDADDKEIGVDNGVAVKVGSYTGKGLQTRYATIAEAKDKVAIVGSAPVIKDSFTKAQASEVNFSIPAGKAAKAYEVLPEEGEVFGVAEYQFTTIVENTVKFGNYVVVDGTGAWKEVASKPASGYGFIGQVAGFETANNITIVLVECVANEQLA